MPMNPWIYICFVLCLTSFGTGWKVQEWRYKAEVADAQADAKAHEQVIIKKADTASENFERDKGKNDVQFKTIRVQVEKIVEKPVYRDVCLDDDGMRTLRGAINGGDSAASSESKDSMPKSDGAN